MTYQLQVEEEILQQVYHILVYPINQHLGVDTHLRVGQQVVQAQVHLGPVVHERQVAIQVIMRYGRIRDILDIQVGH